MQTTVYKRMPTNFNMVGQALPKQLRETDEGGISPSLCKSLLKYATQSMIEGGFYEGVKNWEIEIYTVDGDTQNQYDRYYCVRWKNAKGGYIEVSGILISKRTPSHDHGFNIGQD